MYELYAELRDKKGYNDAMVAKISGVSKVTLSDWKRKGTTPRTATLQKIAEALGVTIDYFTGNNNNAKEAADHAHLIDQYIIEDLRKELAKR